MCGALSTITNEVRASMPSCDHELLRQGAALMNDILVGESAGSSAYPVFR